MNIKIEGLQKTLARFDIKKFEPQIQVCFNKFGARVEETAKQNAPIDEGLLKSSIRHDMVKLGTQITVGVNYAAYVEFGTRRFAAEWVATLPPTWQALAAQSKGGTGGSFAELVERITLWVHRKGLGTGFAGDIGVAGTYSTKTRKRTGSKSTQEMQDKQVAYLITRKILREGIPAQPFLYPAVNECTPLLLKELSEIKV